MSDAWDALPSNAVDDGDHVLVTFRWSKEKGQCYDCGLPAAYRIVSRAEWSDDGDLACSVCAAMAASEGEEITWLFEEDMA